MTSSKPMDPRSIVLFAFGVAIGIYLAYILRDELVVIYVSALFAVVLMPLVRGVMKLHIRQWHPSRGIAVLLIVVLTVGSLGAFFGFALRPAFKDLREFVRELPQRGPQFFARIQQIPVVGDINLDALQEKVQDVASNLAAYVVRFASDWAGTVVRIIAGIVLTVYFILEGDEAYGWFLSLFPMERAAASGSDAGAGLGAHGPVAAGAGDADVDPGSVQHDRLRAVADQVCVCAGRDHGAV